MLTKGNKLIRSAFTCNSACLLRNYKRFGFTSAIKQYKEKNIEVGTNSLWATGNSEHGQCCLPVPKGVVPYPITTIDFENDPLKHIATCLTHSLAITS